MNRPMFVSDLLYTFHMNRLSRFGHYVVFIDLLEGEEVELMQFLGNEWLLHLHRAQQSMAVPHTTTVL